MKKIILGLMIVVPMILSAKESGCITLKSIPNSGGEDSYLAKGSDGKTYQIYAFDQLGEKLGKIVDSNRKTKVKYSMNGGFRLIEGSKNCK